MSDADCGSFQACAVDANAVCDAGASCAGVCVESTEENPSSGQAVLCGSSDGCFEGNCVQRLGACNGLCGVCAWTEQADCMTTGCPTGQVCLAAYECNYEPCTSVCAVP
jgi:hypothetical protein